jgi:hypothetical protein
MAETGRAAGRNLVVFVRAPLSGTVKRRLAAGIGAPAARRFYLDTTRAVIGRLANDARWTTWLAVTPDRFARRGRFWPSGARRFAQGRGDLGERMTRALMRFGGAPTVIVGSDIPDLSARHVAAAFAALGRAETVFGPAGDGGYWLVGCRVPSLMRRLFGCVRWSGPHALADTLANVEGRRVALLDVLDDVDDAADLARLKRVAVRGRVRPSPAAIAR